MTENTYCLQVCSVLKASTACLAWKRGMILCVPVIVWDKVSLCLYTIDSVFRDFGSICVSPYSVLIFWDPPDGLVLCCYVTLQVRWNIRGSSGIIQIQVSCRALTWYESGRLSTLRDLKYLLLDLVKFKIESCKPAECYVPVRKLHVINLNLFYVDFLLGDTFFEVYAR